MMMVSSCCVSSCGALPPLVLPFCCCPSCRGCADVAATAGRATAALLLAGIIVESPLMPAHPHGMEGLTLVCGACTQELMSEKKNRKKG